MTLLFQLFAILIIRKRNYFSFLTPFLAQELETAGKATLKVHIFHTKIMKSFVFFCQKLVNIT